MNMNLDIVNRALYAAGQDMIEADDLKKIGDNTDESSEESKKKSAVYKLCKSYYLATFLEALSEAEWLGGRKRAGLMRTGRPVLTNRKYSFAYDMPYDCAKPIELQDNEYFIVEDRLILTDVPDAELLYVSNGKVLKPIAAAVMKPGMIPESEYFSAGKPGDLPDYTLHPGRPADLPHVKNGTWRVNQKDTGIPDTEPPPEIPDDPKPVTDYPDYIELNYEPKFFEYIEKKLASKFAMKLSEQPQLRNQLLQEALLVKQEAVDASRASRAAKRKPTELWEDELGLG